jgi:hypothetical protein
MSSDQNNLDFGRAFLFLNFDDLVKSKISPPLAGGDKGEGDK